MKEVRYCADCKFWREHSWSKWYGKCDLGAYAWRPAWNDRLNALTYPCAYAEKREEKSED